MLNGARTGTLLLGASRMSETEILEAGNTPVMSELVVK